jgi:hypothetical protein
MTNFVSVGRVEKHFKSRRKELGLRASLKRLKQIHVE